MQDKLISEKNNKMTHDNYHQHGALANVVASLSTTKAGIVSRRRSNSFLGVAVERGLGNS